MIYYKKYKKTKNLYLKEKQENEISIFPNHFKEVEKQFVLDLLSDFGIKTDLKKMLNLNVLQKGGKKSLDGNKIIKFIDSSGLYLYRVFEDTIDESQARIVVLTPTDEECVSIIVDKSTKTAILHNMTYLSECFMSFEGMKKGSGNKLLRFSLNLILNSKFGIKRVVLKDNSFLYCKPCSETVKLPQLRIVTKGETWYSKFGFKPFDPLNQKPSKDLLRSLENTNKILDRMDILEIDILGLIESIVKKEKLKGIDIDEIKRLIKNYPETRRFVSRLADEYQKYCCILSHLLKILFNPETKLGLTDFYGKTFYLDL